MGKTQRKEYLDWLRVFAAFFVVLIHVAGQFFTTPPVTTFGWNTMNFFAGISRWAVNCFIMASGAIFLQRDLSIKTILKKYVVHILVVFYAWSFLFACLDVADGFTPIEAIKRFILGHYHMWFLPMMAGMYIVTPFLRKIRENETLVNYYLVVCFVTSFLLPHIIDVVGIFRPGIQAVIRSLLQSFDIHLAAGYTGVFLLGYVLDTREISVKQEKMIYTLGIFGGFIGTVVLTSLTSIYQGSVSWIFYQNYALCVVMQTTAVFVWMKKHATTTFAQIGKKIPVTTISKYGLTIYVGHCFILERFQMWANFTVLSLPSILSIPLLTIVVYLLTLGLAHILHKIPIVKDWMV